jgi:hypothetical protein
MKKGEIIIVEIKNLSTNVTRLTSHKERRHMPTKKGFVKHIGSMSLAIITIFTTKLKHH